MTNCNEPVECPACGHVWLVDESSLGLTSCPDCGATLEISRYPILWAYAAELLTIVKEIPDD